MYNFNPDLEYEFEGGDIDKLIPEEEPEEEVTVSETTNWPWFAGRAPAVKYSTLGEGHYCEIANCGRQAYTFCDQKMTGCLRPAFEGCSKKLCEEHIEHHYSKSGSVTLVHCKYREGDIREDGRKATKHTL